MARGRWYEILTHYGVDPKLLTKRNQPCPLCGGKDRYRWSDWQGDGRYLCSGCGNGSGFQLLGKLKGWDFTTTVREVASLLDTGSVRPRPQLQADYDSAVEAARLIKEHRRIRAGQRCDRYIADRGLADMEIPAALSEVSTGLLAQMHSVDGDLTGVEVTFLTPGGRHIEGDKPKKFYGKRPAGAAVRLSEDYEDHLGIAEGWVTAMSAWKLFGVPTWAALVADGVAKWVPPSGVTRVTIFADNDLNHRGQAAAHTLAHRLYCAGIEVEVKLPERPSDWEGKSYDWNDALKARGWPHRPFRDFSGPTLPETGQQPLAGRKRSA